MPDPMADHATTIARQETVVRGEMLTVTGIWSGDFDRHGVVVEALAHWCSRHWCTRTIGTPVDVVADTVRRVSETLYNEVR